MVLEHCFVSNRFGGGCVCVMFRNYRVVGSEGERMSLEWLVVGLFWGGILLYLTWEALNQEMGLP